MNLFEPGAGDVSVDLRGGNVGVAEHRLDGTKIGAAFEQMGREGMAQVMGRKKGMQTCSSALPRERTDHVLLLANKRGDDERHDVRPRQGQQLGDSHSWGNSIAAGYAPASGSSVLMRGKPHSRVWGFPVTQ